MTFCAFLYIEIMQNNKSLVFISIYSQSLLTDCVSVVLSSSEPYYQATTDTRLGEENKGHQLLTKMGESACTDVLLTDHLSEKPGNIGAVWEK